MIIGVKESDETVFLDEENDDCACCASCIFILFLGFLFSSIFCLSFLFINWLCN